MTLDMESCTINPSLTLRDPSFQREFIALMEKYPVIHESSAYGLYARPEFTGH